MTPFCWVSGWCGEFMSAGSRTTIAALNPPKPRARISAALTRAVLGWPVTRSMWYSGASLADVDQSAG